MKKFEKIEKSGPNVDFFYFLLLLKKKKNFFFKKKMKNIIKNKKNNAKSAKSTFFLELFTTYTLKLRDFGSKKARDPIRVA